MILKRLKLVNYGGIYNGIGRNEIEIDFTKCKHRIVLIKGDNGSGKSTIENALKPLPEDSTAFIAGKDARKEIEYIDETNGTIYSIVFIHEVSGTTRKTKGFITKIVNGIAKELNPSGNITNCKDIIYKDGFRIYRTGDLSNLIPQNSKKAKYKNNFYNYYLGLKHSKHKFNI
jgi:energy-coupling factor transporter ATP-binding protein EcfA2